MEVFVKLAKVVFLRFTVDLLVIIERNLRNPENMAFVDKNLRSHVGIEKANFYLCVPFYGKGFIKY